MQAGVLHPQNGQSICKGGSGKWKSSNDDEHGQGQKKRRPSTYVEGKNKYVNIFERKQQEMKKANISFIVLRVTPYVKIIMSTVHRFITLYK